VKTEDIDILENFVEGFILGDYSFDKYKSKKSKHIKKIEIMGDEKLLKDVIKVAKIRANAVNYTRDLVNSMPDEIYPEVMADYAKKIAKENGYECKIYDEKYLKKEGYGAFYSVGKASIHKPRLIHLTYKPKKKSWREVKKYSKKYRLCCKKHCKNHKKLRYKYPYSR